MRRIDKPAISEVISDKLMYKVKGKNTRLSQILCNEQYNICAYTETYLGRSDKKDIDHFNPTLKGQVKDNYKNWFLVKAQWNSEKSTKWTNYQPVLHPTDSNFEQRVVYVEGDYYPALIDNTIDEEALNLIKLLKLDDEQLADTRNRYIKRIKDTISCSGKASQKFIDDLLITDRDGIYFIRALEEELNVKVNFDLLKNT